MKIAFVGALIASIVVLAGRIGAKLYRKYQILKSGIAEVDRMSGEDFELLLSSLFEKKGYRVVTTKRSHDSGADVVVDHKGVRTVIQTKRYAPHIKLGVSAVHEVVASMPVYKAQKAMVITTADYTLPAIKLAKANQVELWDRRKLVSELAARTIK